MSSLGRRDEGVLTLQGAADLPGSTARLLLPWGLRFDPRAGRMPGGYACLFPAWALALLGELDEAFLWLEHGFKERAFTILLLDVEDGYEP